MHSANQCYDLDMSSYVIVKCLGIYMARDKTSLAPKLVPSTRWCSSILAHEHGRCMSVGKVLKNTMTLPVLMPRSVETC